MAERTGQTLFGRVPESILEIEFRSGQGKRVSEGNETNETVEPRKLFKLFAQVIKQEKKANYR